MMQGDRRIQSMRRLVPVVAAVAVCAAVATASSASQAAAAKPTLTFAFSIGPVSLDPAKDIGGAPQTMRPLTNESLIHVRPNGTLAAGLATSWRYIGAGYKTFEITLRRNARFSDGTPVTASAVKTWFNYFANAKGPWVSSLGKVSSITTRGRWIATLHLSEPNPALPFALSELYPTGSVTGPKGVANPATLGTRTVGAGPYVVVPSQSVAGDHYTLTPNKFYYNPRAIHWSKVIVKVITSPNTMLAAAKTGQVDVAFGDATTAVAAKKAGLGVISAPTGTEGLVFTDRGGKLVPALGDVRVRQALNYALNRQQITKALFGEYGTPTSEILSVDGWDPKYQNYYAYDPQKAKSLLAAAGYASGFTFSATIPSFVGVLGDPLASAIARDLAAVGVKMEFNSTTTNTQFVTDALGTNHSAFQATQGSFPMWLAYGLEFSPKAPLNPFGVADPVVDTLFQQAVTAKNPGPIWQRMSRRIATQALWLPVFGVEWIWYVSPRVGGVTVSAKSLFPLASDWYPK